MPDLIRNPSALAHDRRPSDDQGRADAAFVAGQLRTTQWRVADVGPRQSVGGEGVMRAWKITRAAAWTDWHSVLAPAIVLRLGREPEAARRRSHPAVRSGPVVREEHHQGVVRLAGLLDYLQKLAKAAVDRLHLSGVHRHAFRLPVLVRVCLPIVDACRPRRQLPRGGDDAQLALLQESSLPPLVPASFPVLLTVGCDVCLAGVQGPVRSDVRHVQEEGLLSPDSLFEKLNREVVDGVRQIEILGHAPRDRGPDGRGSAQPRGSS